MANPFLTTHAQDRTDVLILTSSTGGGHDSVAAALQAAIHALAPRIGVRVLDPLAGRGCLGPLAPAHWYNALVAWAPWLWGLFYHATNNAWAARLGLAMSKLLWSHRLRDAILATQPRLVVSVHPICTQLAAHVLRTLPAAPPLHCVVTDLVSIHRCWACPQADTFYVATPEACAALVTMGIPRARMHLTGLPLRPSFAQAPRPSRGGPLRIPGAQGLTPGAQGPTAPAERAPQALLLGGGRPSRRLERVARALAASCPSWRLVVVCGHNTRLRRRLTRALGARATVLGWCDDRAIAVLMRESSVVVTKAGPTTVAEALSQARPLLLYQALPGQEAGNVALVERGGAGCYASTAAALAQAIAAHTWIAPESAAAQARWWGGAAQRVAARLLAAQGTLRPYPARRGHLRPAIATPVWDAAVPAASSSSTSNVYSATGRGRANNGG